MENFFFLCLVLLVCLILYIQFVVHSVQLYKYEYNASSFDAYFFLVFCKFVCVSVCSGGGRGGEGEGVGYCDFAIVYIT